MKEIFYNGVSRNSATIIQLTKDIINELKELADNAELVIPITSKDHQFYLVLKKQKSPEVLIVVHNLGSGLETLFPKQHYQFKQRTHHFNLKRKGEILQAKPRVLGCESLEKSKWLENYLLEIIKNYGQDSRIIEAKAYDHAGNLNPAIKPQYSWLTSQTRGNCVTRNYESHQECRWQAHPEVLQWIRRREFDFLKIKAKKITPAFPEQKLFVVVKKRKEYEQDDSSKVNSKHVRLIDNTTVIRSNDSSDNSKTRLASL